MAQFNLPALSLAVIKDGEIVKSEGYGLADRERKVPATRDTVYKIGSISKQFIATGIMLLVNERRLTLDDPVAKHLTDAPAAWKPITVRHLLTHTSGLPRESPAFDPMQNRSDRELLSALHAVPLRFVPGEKWEYSNSGYIALAEIIRVASGQPWADFLHQRVFAPAGMNATMPTNTQAVIANRASGYTSNDNQCKAPEWVALRASGAFLSSVVDLAKWEALLYTDKILDGAARKQMWTRARLNDGTTAAYGLGWFYSSNRLIRALSPKEKRARLVRKWSGSLIPYVNF